MTLPLALALLLAPAQAGSRWLQNDGFDDGDMAGFQGGFIAGECWGSLYVPEPDEYPFELDKVRMLVGGDSSMELFTIHFYNISGTTWNTSGYLGGEGVAITGSNESFNDVAVADLELGLPAITSGNVGVSVCLEKHSGYPAIARDTDGMAYANRNYIYASGGWWQSSVFGLNGDWIMRLCIVGDGVADEGCSDGGGDGGSGDGGGADGGATDGGGSGDGGGGDGGATDGGTADGGTGDGGAGDGGDTGLAALALLSITPTSTEEGTAVDVVLLGQGFGEGSEARIGGIPLTGQNLVNTETIQGRTPTTLPAGVHDVEVVYDGESALLAGAFEVTAAAAPEPEEDGGCGCAAGPGQGAGLGLLGGLLGLLGWRRRR